MSIKRIEMRPKDENGEYGDILYPKTSVDMVEGLHEVATTGSYNDLLDKPTISTATYSGVGGSNSFQMPNCIAEGVNSHAEGFKTYAYGENSHAEGIYSLALSGFYNRKISSYDSTTKTITLDGDTGNDASIGGKLVIKTINSQSIAVTIVDINGVVITVDTTPNNSWTNCIVPRPSTNNCSHAEGINVIASGQASHAEGISTIASGANSHAEGWSTTASGQASHAEGRATISSGTYSHAEGWRGTASGASSHVEGFNSTASGTNSHAEGQSSTASGANSHAEGGITKASGANSHAEGQSSTASGASSHAEGWGTTALLANSHVEGYKTMSFEGVYYSMDEIGYYYTDMNILMLYDELPEFVVGANLYFLYADGSSSNSIITNVQEGRYVFLDVPPLSSSINGVLFPPSTPSTITSAHVEGGFSIVGAKFGHAEGYGTKCLGENSHSEGLETRTSGVGSHAEGYDTDSDGDYSHAEGDGCSASGIGSHAEGRWTSARGDYSHAEGNRTSSYSLGSHAEGSLTNSDGDYGHAEGVETTVIGVGGHAEGYKTKANTYSHAEGQYTNALSLASHAEGSYSQANSYYAHAEGNHCLAMSTGSHAEGYYSIADEATFYEVASIVSSTVVTLSATPTGLATQKNIIGIFSNGTIKYGQITAINGLNITLSSGFGATTALIALCLNEISTLGTLISAHAEGKLTIATGSASHAEGDSSRAIGRASHAEGFGTMARSAYSHSQGEGTQAYTFAEDVMGRFNKVETINDTYVATGNALVVGNGTSATVRSNAFRVTFDGKVYGLSAFNATGADYAEWFEWSDGNTENEERIARFVSLSGDKIKFAQEGDEILGVISTCPSMIGDAHEDIWSGMYLKDVFGRTIYEETETGEIIPKVNPHYDSSKEYVPRSKRKEWGIVGLLGKILVFDDGTCEENGYCESGVNGIATKSNKGYRVMKRIEDNLIQIFFK